MDVAVCHARILDLLWRADNKHDEDKHLLRHARFISLSCLFVFDNSKSSFLNIFMLFFMITHDSINNTRFTAIRGNKSQPVLFLISYNYDMYITALKHSGYTRVLYVSSNFPNHMIDILLCVAIILSQRDIYIFLPADAHVVIQYIFKTLYTHISTFVSRYFMYYVSPLKRTCTYYYILLLFLWYRRHSF